MSQGMNEEDQKTLDGSSEMKLEIKRLKPNDKESNMGNADLADFKKGGINDPDAVADDAEAAKGYWDKVDKKRENKNRINAATTPANAQAKGKQPNKRSAGYGTFAPSGVKNRAGYMGD